MRATVYIPTGTSHNLNVTPASKTEVDTESLDALLDKLATEAPLRTRVVVVVNRTTYHYVLGQRGWECRLRVVA